MTTAKNEIFPKPTVRMRFTLLREIQEAIGNAPSVDAMPARVMKAIERYDEARTLMLRLPLQHKP